MAMASGVWQAAPEPCSFGAPCCTTSRVKRGQKGRGHRQEEELESVPHLTEAQVCEEPRLE